MSLSQLSVAFVGGFALASIVTQRFRNLRKSSCTAADATTTRDDATDCRPIAAPLVAEPSSRLTPRCVVILREVTSDRYIHYLLRPATALGASEVIWLGAMKAKGDLNTRSNYGRAMRSEVSVPLENLTSMFQAKRHITASLQEGASQRLFVVGVSLKRISRTNESGEAFTSAPLTSINFNGIGCGVIALYFSGPDGVITPEDAAHCDVVVHVIPDGPEAAGTHDDGGGSCRALNISAMLSVVLHHVSVKLRGSCASTLKLEPVADKFATLKKEKKSRPGIAAAAPATVPQSDTESDASSLCGLELLEGGQ